MNIVYYGRTRRLNCEAEIEGLKYYSDLNKMLAVTDCVFVACPLLPETKHLINKDRFKHMKSRVRLVNVGRGPIVEESAVIDALERGQLVGAGFDVFEFEPKVDERLLKNKKITILPHIGACTKQSFEEFERKCVNNLVETFFGEGKPAAVNLLD
ncbi:unnamed protein product [Ambrosiozyma monospora]|uniref:Unnamed protein product n=1 Tax=Ambrosiozyma monospora TaxID=43982 RepID=A0A9W6T6B8_AMBMO|nr:unnamed protein product [Ambrosiozyma monospora]